MQIYTKFLNSIKVKIYYFTNLFVTVNCSSQYKIL